MKRNKKLKYAGFTMLVLFLCTAGYFGIRNIVHGAYQAAEPYVTGEAIAVDDTVTPQSDNAIPLTSTNKALPEIPRTFETKGTKDNPFVVLEIVPHHSEQALSYLVSTEEEGLPYDPIQVGIDICTDMNTTMIKQFENGSTNFNNKLSEKIGGVFNNNNHYLIYDDNGVDEKTVDYSYIKEYYTMELSSELIEEEHFDNYDMEKMAETYPKLFKKDKNGNEISEIAIKDDRDWVKEKKKTAEYSYTVMDSELVTPEDFQNLSIKELAEKYTTLFKTDKNGKEIEAVTLSDENTWVRSSGKSTENTVNDLKNKGGYFYHVGSEKGDYKLDNYYYLTIASSDTASDNRWIYIEKEEDLPQESFSIQTKYAGKEWEVANHMNDETLLNGYFKVSEMKLGTFYENAYTFTYNKAEYNYVYRFYGLAINDILKRRLFQMNKESYDNFHIKVISLTPAEINEMDREDTANTLSYVERADMFYVAMFDKNDDNIKNHINFYRKYIAKEEGVSKNSDVTYYDYLGNDLEWTDCMKIIKRLSSNQNLPMMYENVVGSMLNSGVNGNGSINSHIYLNEKNACCGQIGSLNNIAKLFLTTVQMDLIQTNLNDTENFFMNKIYPNLKQIRVNVGEGADKNTAKYTGYYERKTLCTCEQSVEFKKKSFYLWGKAIFYPNEVFSNPNSEKLVTENGYLAEFIASQDPASFSNSKYNGGMERANSSRGNESESNVAIVYDSSANTNKTIFDNGGFNNMGKIMELILNNVSKTPKEIELSVLKNKPDYKRINNENVLLSYAMDAKYNQDKTLTLKCQVKNQNNEDSIIQSVSLENEFTGERKTLSINGMNKRSITFSNGNSAITGYLISKNDSITIEIPFSRADWQKEFQVISIVTIPRMSYQKKTKTTYVTGAQKEYRVSVLESSLFDLE